MGAQLGTDGGFSDINMTPLIDIVLVVLIIMMVNIPIQIEQMGIKVPGPKQDPPPPPPENSEQLVVAIYEDGGMALNRTSMGADKIKYELSRRLRPMAEKRVFVDAHGTIEYGKVVDAVDLAREAGAQQVGLARLKDGGPAPIVSIDSGSSIPRGIHFGSPVVRAISPEATIDEAKADQAIQRVKGKLTACYTQRLANRPGLTGAYSIIIEAGPDGAQLSEPQIESDSVNDLDLRDCFNLVLPEIRYPPLGSQQTAAVRYSILFSPGT